MARKLGAMDMQLLVIDTECRFLSTGQAERMPRRRPGEGGEGACVVRDRGWARSLRRAANARIRTPTPGCGPPTASNPCPPFLRAAGFAQEVAKAAGGRYHHLPYASDAAVTAAANTWLKG